MVCRCKHNIDDHEEIVECGVQNQACTICGCVDYSEVETYQCEYCGKIIRVFDEDLEHECNASKKQKVTNCPECKSTDIYKGFDTDTDGNPPCLICNVCAFIIDIE